MKMNYNIRKLEENILYIEPINVLEGDARLLFEDVVEEVRNIKKPYAVIVDFKEFDNKRLVIPDSEVRDVMRISEYFSATGRAVSVWVSEERSLNKRIFQSFHDKKILLIDDLNYVNEFEAAVTLSKEKLG